MPDPDSQRPIWLRVMAALVCAYAMVLLVVFVSWQAAATAFLIAIAAREMRSTW